MGESPGPVTATRNGGRERALDARSPARCSPAQRAQVGTPRPRDRARGRACPSSRCALTPTSDEKVEPPIARATGGSDCWLSPALLDAAPARFIEDLTTPRL